MLLSRGARGRRDTPTSTPEAAAIAACAAVVAAALFAGTAVCAQEPAPLPPHVRPESPDGRRFVEQAMSRSALIGELIDRLEATDVIVYLRFRPVAEFGLEGRVRFLSSTGTQRFLVIDLACVRPRVDQIATFGHELHHALEIAAEPSIVNTASLAAYYERAGMETGQVAGSRTFETAAARATGVAVRKEVFATSERRSYGK